MSWDSEGDSTSIFSSLDRGHLVLPQLTTFNDEAIFVGEAIIPDSRQSIKSNAHGVDRKIYVSGGGDWNFDRTQLAEGVS